MLDVITLGETMVLLAPVETGSLKYVNNFSKHLGGAESNFAIGLSRLGFKTGWISRLGNDSFGDYIEFFLRGEGIDISRVKRDNEHPTGLMIKERRGIRETKVYYYRNNSAASKMDPEDLDEEYLRQAKFLHLTGITPALSSSCKELTFKAIDFARENGITITFDPNLRLKLWEREEMQKVILDICSKVDIVLPGLEEGKILLDLEKPEEIINEILKLGPKVVVLKAGKKGAFYGTRSGKEYVPGYQVECVDPIGAGDGFAAGFVAGQLKGYDLYKSVKLANAVGAFAVTVKGDVEGLPTWDELQVFLGNKENTNR